MLRSAAAILGGSDRRKKGALRPFVWVVAILRQKRGHGVGADLVLSA